MTDDSGSMFRIKGTASEKHRHDELAGRVLLLEVRLRELRAEWDEFIAAMYQADEDGESGDGTENDGR